MQPTVSRPAPAPSAGASPDSKQSGRLNAGAAVVAAGLLAGLAFLALELLASLFLGASSPLGPAYMMVQALEAGHDVTEVHDPVVVTVGIVIHLFLSVATLAVLGAFVHRWLTAPAVAVGVVYGGILFVVTFLLAGGAGLEAWDALGLATLFNYAAFGALGAWLFKRLQRRE